MPRAVKADAAAQADQEHLDFFVSYRNVSPDRQWAEWIAWHLESEGYSVLVQAWDFLPGSNFVAKMQEGVAGCDRTVAVLSPRYFESDFTAAEWSAVFARDPLGEKGLLVPVRIEEFSVEGLLGLRVYVDLVGLDQDAARRLLLESLPRERRKPAAEPDYPGGAGAAPAAARGAAEPPFPGALPAHWNVPLLRNANFTGRDALFIDLEATLARGQPTVLTQVLRGYGGVGKTQVAAEYAYRRASAYNIVWWLPSENDAALAAEYAALGVALGIPGNPNEQKAYVEATRRHLEARQDWLLVFDNAEEPPALARFLPRGGGGHVLVTSRSHDWGAVSTAKPLDVGLFTQQEAIQFLSKRTGRAAGEAAGELARELGLLPVAIAQAAGYIAQTGISAGEYLKLFRERRAELWKHEKPAADYPYTVATAWDLTKTRIQQENPDALHIVNVLAFLAPDHVPRDLLPRLAEHLPGDAGAALADSLRLNAAVEVLLRHGVVTAGEGTLSMHRIQQVVVRDGLVDGNAWFEGVAKGMAQAFRFEYGADNHRMGEFAPLMPHAMAAAEAAVEAGVGLADGARLFNSAAAYHMILGNAVRARRLLERSLAIDEKTYGPDHPTVATSLSNLALVHEALGDAARARGLLERALAIDEKTYGPDHPEVATDLSNLALVHEALGDAARARGLLERALAIAEKTYGPDHPTVATRLSNLALVHEALGDAARARGLLERALAIDERTYGPDHPKVAILRGNLGLVLKDLGDPAGARRELEAALAIFLKFYDEIHPHVKVIRRRLAALDD